MAKSKNSGMMELKTIKDFEDGWKDYDRIFIKKLKQEIIERAKSYVELVERIMRIVGIIKNNEIITTKSLISQFGGYNYTNYQLKSKKVKYQTLYDLFKLRNDEDIFIKIEHAIKEIFNEFQKILNMNGGISHGVRYLHNSKWDVNISSFSVSVISKELGKSYGLNDPNQDIEVLERFLLYYRECCEKHGIEII
ncbi:hypothetical protein LCGC14_2153560 [marine sediment metagenome]|uniref:Uncharacterized protein n=1 Tax=marine sediment metagenome TaxID=412755 RepID=A0A0F9EH14_9ZZZZ